MIEKMLIIPKNHKRRSPLRLILLIGVTVLIFLVAAQQIGQMTTHLAQP